MKTYIVYEKQTGRPIQIVGTTEDKDSWEYEDEDTGQLLISAATQDMTKVHVVGRQVLPRPQNPTTLSGLTLSNVPVPSTIHINDQSYPCDEDTVELEFEHPGTYHIRVESWPHLDKEFVVENPA